MKLILAGGVVAIVGVIIGWAMAHAELEEQLQAHG